MYETSSFCERCGLDRDRLGSAGAREFNVCPDCSSSCCSNCWNQVAGACLACRPFELAGATTAGAWALRPSTIDLQATQKPSRGDERPSSSTRSIRPVPAPVAPAVAAVADSSASAKTYARRGMAKAARLALVIAVVLAVVVGVRAVNFNGGAVAAQDSVAPTPTATTEEWVITGSYPPIATAAPGLTDPSPPDSRPGSGGTNPAPAGGGTGGGGGGGGGNRRTRRRRLDPGHHAHARSHGHRRPDRHADGRSRRRSTADAGSNGPVDASRRRIRPGSPTPEPTPDPHAGRRRRPTPDRTPTP